MKSGICYIVGAGEHFETKIILKKEDYVIAADGGLTFLEEINISADLVIGDFDTLQYIPNHPNVITLPENKDDTDMFAAVYEGIKLGYEIFFIYGGSGGRIDHTIANVQLLNYLSLHRKKGFLFCSDSVMTTVTNGNVRFSPYDNGYISVFSLSEKSYGVDEIGLKYKLEQAELTNTFPIGVSNEFIGKESEIAVCDGTLLVVFPKEAMSAVGYEK